MRSCIIWTLLAVFGFSPMMGSRASAVDFKLPEVDPRARKCGLYIEPRTEAAKAQVEFSVTEPSGVARRGWPVRGSIPLFRGELKDTSRIVLLDDKGKQIPVQGKATALWPEGTAKFICLDFLTDLRAGETRKYTLRFGTAVPPYGQGGIKTTQNGKTISVDTGKLQVSFSPGSAFSSAVKVDGKEVTREALTGFLTLSEGTPESTPKAYALTIDTVKLEEQGPVQATVYLKGRYGNMKTVSKFKGQKKYDRFVFHGFVRLYAGSARMDVIHSFGFNGNEHKDFVRRYGLTVPLKADKGRFTFGKDAKDSATTTITDDLLLAQPHHSNWKLSGGAADMKGKRFGGWASVSGQGASVLMGLRNAWQQWPVSFRANAKGDLSIDIHGGEDANFLDLRYSEKESGLEWITPDPKKRYTQFAKHHVSKSMYIGEKVSTHYQAKAGFKAAGILKISELVIDFTPGADGARVGQAHHRMLVPWPGRERYADTRVFGLTGYFADKDAKSKNNFNFHARNIVDLPLVQHEANGLYGWVDYPDGLDVKPPKKGETRFNTDKFQGGEGWNNGEKVNQAVVSLYVASGWRRALDYGHQMLLHTMGIDVEHRGGDQATGVTHRHCQVHWGTGGSPRQSGCYIGWYWYYWISGHNEIGRSLVSVYPHPLGIHYKRGGAAEWPHHPSYNIEKDFITPKGVKTVIATAAKGSIYHWVNFNRWQTTGETRFVRYFDSLYNGLKQNPYKLKKGKKTYNPRLRVSLIDDTEYAKPKGDPPNPDNPPRPNFYDYYFRAYYGKALITEWAQLTGSKHAVDLLLMMGDYDWEDSHPPAPESIHKKKLQWLYYSHGQYMAAYYMLRGQDAKYSDRIGRMLELIQARTTRPSNRMGEVPDPENYTAQEFTKAFKPQPWNCKPWGKNGLKNIGGHMNAVLWNLWFYRDVNQKQMPEKHKSILAP